MSLITLLIAAVVTVFLIALVQKGMAGELAWVVYAVIIVLWLVVLIYLLAPSLPGLRVG